MSQVSTPVISECDAGFSVTWSDYKLLVQAIKNIEEEKEFGFGDEEQIKLNQLQRELVARKWQECRPRYSVGSVGQSLCFLAQIGDEPL